MSASTARATRKRKKSAESADVVVDDEASKVTKAAEGSAPPPAKRRKQSDRASKSKKASLSGKSAASSVVVLDDDDGDLDEATDHDFIQTTEPVEDDIIDLGDSDDALLNEIDALVESKSSKKTGKAKARPSLSASATVQADVPESISNQAAVDFSKMKMRPDHSHRPIWVCPNRNVYLEAFSPHYKEAYDFLIAIADPVARTHFMHTYHLNRGSLYAAISSGLEADQILRYLDQLSKVEIPKEISKFVKKITEKLGKAKLVLRKNRYYIESPERKILELLLEDEAIQQAAKSEITFESTEAEAAINFPAEMDMEQLERELDRAAAQIDAETAATEDGTDPDLVSILHSSNSAAAPATQGGEAAPKRREFYCFEIDPKNFEDVKRRCIDLDLPLLEEYDFAKDTINPDISISLKLTTSLRKYQEKSLSKMFTSGRARSGIISLPCGAGKSLVGVVAATTIKKKTLVLCTGVVSVQQWVHQFKLWTTIHHTDVVPFVAGTNKQKISSVQDLGSVLVTTYSMLVASGKRSVVSNRIIELIQSQEWGLILLDEVHVVPANTFRKVISTVKSHCKLGLTATLVREDDMIDHLLYLIGPKMYEANWLDLVRSGHIANVRCCEVWCPMTSEFYSEYLRADPKRQPMLYIMNPNKIKACEFLVRFHEARDHKVIVFSDNIFALKFIAKLLDRPFIYGETPNTERTRIFTQFQYNASVKTIFVSKIGDNSIDLPEANVIVQISSQYGSRRQEAQRLGRILRPKSKSSGRSNFDAFFYSLVSTDTKEMFYASKRQQFLVEQGYAFSVFQSLHTRPGLSSMKTSKEQLDLLTNVLAESIDELEKVDKDDIDIAAIDAAVEAYEIARATQVAGPARAASAVKPEPVEEIVQMPSEYRVLSYTRSAANIESLTGAAGLNYEEYDY